MVNGRKAGDGASGGASKALAPAASASRDSTRAAGVGGFVSRIGSALAPRRRAVDGGGKPARPPSPWNKLLFGAMVYLLGSLLLQPLIILLFSWFHISPAARQPFFPANTPLIGNANIYTLVYFVFLAVFIWLLFRFNIIPRDPFGVRANAQQTSRTASSSATQVSESPAALRHAGKRRLPTTVAPEKAKPSRFAARQTSAKALPKTATGATVKPTAKAVSTRAPSSAKNVGAHGATNSNQDGHYDRVKALQRVRRRKR